MFGVFMYVRVCECLCVFVYVCSFGRLLVTTQHRTAHTQVYRHYKHYCFEYCPYITTYIYLYTAGYITIPYLIIIRKCLVIFILYPATWFCLIRDTHDILLICSLHPAVT